MSGPRGGYTCLADFHGWKISDFPLHDTVDLVHYVEPHNRPRERESIPCKTDALQAIDSGRWLCTARLCLSYYSVTSTCFIWSRYHYGLFTAPGRLSLELWAVWYGGWGVTQFLNVYSVKQLLLSPGGQRGTELCTCATRVAVRNCGQRFTFIWRFTFILDEGVPVSGALCVLKACRLKHGCGW